MRQAGVVEVVCVEDDEVSLGGVSSFPGWEHEIEKDGPKDVEVGFREIPLDDEEDVRELTFKAHAHDGCEIHAQIKGD